STSSLFPYTTLFRSVCTYLVISYLFFFSRCVNISIDGMKNPRIINVSSRIPIAIKNPNRNNSSIGCVIRTENVAAKMTPADEITPPVRRTPWFTAPLQEKLFCVCSNSINRNVVIATSKFDHKHECVNWHTVTDGIIAHQELKYEPTKSECCCVRQ